MTHLADIQKLTINLDAYALLTSCRFNRGVKFIPLLQEVDQPTDTIKYHYAFPPRRPAVIVSALRRVRSHWSGPNRFSTLYSRPFSAGTIFITFFGLSLTETY